MSHIRIPGRWVAVWNVTALDIEAALSFLSLYPLPSPNTHTELVQMEGHIPKLCWE